MVDRAGLERVRYVAGHFEVLSGLTVLPMLTWFALALAWANGWTAGWVVLAGGLLAVVATAAAVAHYRRRYGQVRPRPGRTTDTFLLWPVTGLFVATGFADVAGSGLPISVPGLILSAGALAGAWFQRPLAPAFLFVGLAGAAASVAPLGSPHPLSDTETWLFAACVGAAVLAGWSHLVLRRALAPAPERDR